MSKNIGWLFGVLQNVHNVNTEDMTAEEAFAKLRELEQKNYKKSKKIVELPKKEYAELCSAIRTKFADKIPKEGFILYKNDCYCYNYNKKNHQIICVSKLEIAKNEEIIAIWERIYNE